MDLYCFSEILTSPAEFANYKCTHTTEPNCSVLFLLFLIYTEITCNIFLHASNNDKDLILYRKSKMGVGH